MIFNRKHVERHVSLTKDTKDGILSYCKMKHPNEAILVLSGKSKKGVLTIDKLVIPPFSHTETTFGGIPSSFLPLDSSYIGMLHSHPDGKAKPSEEDSNNFFGLVTIIVKSPYGENDIFAWDRHDDPIEITVV